MLAVAESFGDALIDGSRPGVAFGLTIRLDSLKGQSIVSLSEFECDAGYGGGGAMLDGQADAIVTVAAKIEVGIAQAWNSDEPRKA